MSTRLQTSARVALGGPFVVVGVRHHRRDGLGLDTDLRRLIRLPFQPILIAWALWATR